MTRTDPSRINCDLCIIGAGSGGLSVAAAAAQMGARVVLVEAGAMGGDCLNTGCVPSKAMIAAAQAAHGGEGAPELGIAAATPRIDFAAVHAHVRRVIAAIAPHDSVERFESLGVQVVKAEARFTAPDEIIAGTQRITARRFVIAAGSRAALPPIPGLAEAGAYTNETIFDLTERPEHLIVIGGGPIGLELSQAFRRLGSAVTVLERHVILPRDEPEAAELIRRRLREDGLDLRESIQIDSVRRDAAGVTVGIADRDGKRSIAGTHLLVAAGRQPNVERLGLEAAGIVFTPKGITVDAGLRTSNRKAYAIGDIAGGPQFTHIAGYHAGLVIRSALLGLPAKVDYTALPWVTFLDPEIAHVGLTEAEARKQHGSVTVLARVLRPQRPRRHRAGDRRIHQGHRRKARPHSRCNHCCSSCRRNDLALGPCHIEEAEALGHRRHAGALSDALGDFQAGSGSVLRAGGLRLQGPRPGQARAEISALIRRSCCRRSCAVRPSALFPWHCAAAPPPR